MHAYVFSSGRTIPHKSSKYCGDSGTRYYSGFSKSLLKLCRRKKFKFHGFERRKKLHTPPEMQSIILRDFRQSLFEFVNPERQHLFFIQERYGILLHSCKFSLRRYLIVTPSLSSLSLLVRRTKMIAGLLLGNTLVLFKRLGLQLIFAILKFKI